MRYLLVVGVVLIVGTAQAGDRDYRRMSGDELAAAFAAGEAVPPPAGAYRGRVTWVDAARLPHARGAMQSALWKGKTFHGDDTFTNRFPGFEALPSAGRCEASWTDGRPAYVLDYPTNYPLFGSNRDELRRVACGVWLGRVWDRKTCKPTAWFILVPK